LSNLQIVYPSGIDHFLVEKCIILTISAEKAVRFRNDVAGQISKYRCKRGNNLPARDVFYNLPI
jgi:hypothetical protein